MARTPHTEVVMGSDYIDVVLTHTDDSWAFRQAQQYMDRIIVEALLLPALVANDLYPERPITIQWPRECRALVIIPNQCRALVGPVRKHAAIND